MTAARDISNRVLVFLLLGYVVLNIAILGLLFVFDVNSNNAIVDEVVLNRIKIDHLIEQLQSVKQNGACR